MKNEVGLSKKYPFTFFIITLALLIFLVNYQTSNVLGLTITANTSVNLSTTDTGNWVGTSNLGGMDLDIATGLVYTGIASGKFGVYNRTSNVWTDLSTSDTADWIGTSNIQGLVIDQSHRLVYVSTNNGGLGAYNITSGVLSDLSSTDTDNWVSTTGVNEIAYDPVNDLVYTVLTSGGGGKFGVYNRTSNVWTNLSNLDYGSWVNSNHFLNGVGVDENNSLVYTGMGSSPTTSSLFGVYNRTSNNWTDLSSTDSGDWAGTSNINEISVNSMIGLVYTGHTNGDFGVYNRSSGVWTDLSSTDSGDWVGTGMLGGSIVEIETDFNSELIYTGISQGKFGVYNRTSNVWNDLSAVDVGNWAGSLSASQMIIDQNNSLIYLGYTSGGFGVYSRNGFDDAVPNVNFSSIGTTPQGNFSRNYIEANVTASDNIQLANITVYLYNSTSLIIQNQSNTSPFPNNFTGLSSGTYYLNATANDTFGNINSTPTIIIILDSNPPSISIPIYTNGTVKRNSTNLTLNISTSDSFSGISTCMVNVNGTNQTIAYSNGWCNSSSVYLTGLSNGNRSILIYVNDTVGNMALNNSYVVSMDSTSPLVSIIYPQNITYSSNISSLNYTSSDSTSLLCWYSQNGGANNSSLVSGGTNFTLSSTEGSNQLIVYCNDSVGNLNSSNVSFFIDTIYPLISYSAGTPSNETYLSQNWIFVNVSINETSFSNVTFKIQNSTGVINSTTYNNSARSINWTSLLNGIYNYSVITYDIAGNSNDTSSRQVVLDSTPPNSLSLFNYTNATIRGNSTTLTIRVLTSDSLSGISTCMVNVNGTNQTIAYSNGWCNSSSVYLTGLSNGNHSLSIYSVDVTGNSAINNSYYVNINNTLPTLNFSCSPLSVNLGETITCNCSASDLFGVESTSYTQNPSTSSVGAFVSTCSATNIAGNQNSTNISYNVISSSSAPASSSSGSSGGGGGSGGGDSERDDPTTDTLSNQGTITRRTSIVNIEPDEQTSVKGFDETGIKEILLSVSQQIPTASITVQKYDSKPDEISKSISGSAYRYFHIEVGDLNEDIESAIVDFEVEKKWVEENDFETDNIVILKFNESQQEWNELSTQFEGEENETYIYSVNINSFSFFAVGSKAKPTIVSGIVDGVSESYDVAKRKRFGLFAWWSLVFTLGGLILVVLANIIKKSHKVRNKR